MKAEYIAGGTSYRKLAAKYNVSKSDVERRAKREKWVDLRRRAQDKVDTNIINSVSKAETKVDTTYFRLVDKLLKKTEDVIDAMPVWTITSIKEMATALKYIKECKGVRSEADIREQEARIRNLEKQAMIEDKDVAVTISFEEDGETQKWAE
jgi:hypothetical protein